MGEEEEEEQEEKNRASSTRLKEMKKRTSPSVSWDLGPRQHLSRDPSALNKCHRPTTKL